MPMVVRRNLRSFTACTLVSGALACSSGGPLDGSGSGSKTPTNLKKGSGTSESDDNESSEADSPQEIAGGFLTCSYVSPSESGFPDSEDLVPVGCVIAKNGQKITSPNNTYKIGLYTSDKKHDSMATRQASQSSKWHGFGHLARLNKSDHLLGITVTNRDSNQSQGPAYFPVKDLKPVSQEVMLNLVGGYRPSGNFPMETAWPNQQMMADLGLIQQLNNKTSPIVPLTVCENGVKRREYDMSQTPDLLSMGAVIAKELGTVVDVPLFKMNLELKATYKPKEVQCFVLVKEAAKEKFDKPIGTPKPVLEGEGCLFLQSSEGFFIYDQDAVKKNNINKEVLESYVKARLCPD